MSKKRTDYVYVAVRIDPDHPQNLGDYSIQRRTKYGWRSYHYNSQNRRLINRMDWAMPVIQSGSRIYRECMRAIDRLQVEEAS